MPPETDLYEKDYYAWANETAAAIRSGEFCRIDTIALADEVADIARQEKRSLRSRLEVLISHLLKWDYQDKKRTRSWAAIIAVQRIRAFKLLTDSPSLTPWLSENLAAMYKSPFNWPYGTPARVKTPFRLRALARSTRFSPSSESTSKPP